MALLSVTLGVVVLTGWMFQVQILVQLHPKFAQGLGAAVFLIGALTLIQYATGLDLYIDQLFMEHGITTESPYPGRMAPATASAYLLSGMALIIVSAWPDRRLLIGGILASLVFALGLGNAFGYTLGTDTPFGTSAVTYMAVHTSLGVMLLGAALFTHVLSIAQATGNITPPWIPWPIGVCLATLSIALWQVLLTNANFQIERNIELVPENRTVV